MKYIIIALLLLSSCADKKEQETQTTTNIPQTNTQQIDTPIEISYDRGLELVLVYTEFNNMVTYYKIKTPGEILLFDTIYWDSNDNIYYTVTNRYYIIEEVTDTKFIYSIDESKQLEPVLYPTMREIFTNTVAPLLYMGSISPLERVYLDPTNQEYYIKHLAIWDTSVYTESDIINTNTLPLYPYIEPDFNIHRKYDSETHEYLTNADGSWIYVTNHDRVPFLSLTNTNYQLFSMLFSDSPLIYKGLITNK